ncbi:MAG: P-loop NTPase [Candidatus Aenigmatarchaeota archaeon]
MTRIISVISGKGGVGKTLISTNLSYALSNFGFRTLLMDFNFTTPHISLYLSSRPTFTLNEFLQEEADFYEILNPTLNFFYISPSLSIEEIRKIDLNKINKLKENLKFFDFVIIDSAPGFGREAIISIDFSDEILIVSNPTISSLFDSIKCIQLANKLNKKVLGIIINRYEKDSPLTIKDFQNMINAEIIGIINEYKKAKYADLTKKLLYDLDKNFREQINQIAAKIANIEYKQKTFKDVISNFIRKFSKLI